jgi:hypothetical protein
LKGKFDLIKVPFSHQPSRHNILSLKGKFDLIQVPFSHQPSSPKDFLKKQRRQLEVSGYRKDDCRIPFDDPANQIMTIEKTEKGTDNRDVEERKTSDGREGEKEMEEEEGRGNGEGEEKESVVIVKKDKPVVEKRSTRPW